MRSSKRLLITIVISALTLVLTLHLGFPREVVPVVLAGFTDTPTSPPEPPTSTPKPPTSTPKPSKPKPTNTPAQPAGPTPTPAAVAAAPSTGGLLDFRGLVWLALGLVLGGITIWGLWRPGSAGKQ